MFLSFFNDCQTKTLIEDRENITILQGFVFIPNYGTYINLQSDLQFLAHTKYLKVHCTNTYHYLVCCSLFYVLINIKF